MNSDSIKSNSFYSRNINLISAILFSIWISVIIYGIIIIVLCFLTNNWYFLFLLLFWNVFSYISYIIMYYPTSSIVDTIYYLGNRKKWEGNPEFIKDIAAQLLEALVVGIISILVFGSYSIFINVIIEIYAIVGVLTVFITLICSIFYIMDVVADK